jgi:hypothetical protein
MIPSLMREPELSGSGEEGRPFFVERYEAGVSWEFETPARDYVPEEIFDPVITLFIPTLEPH